MALDESLKSHKPYNSEYWRGSKAMIKNVIETMNTIESKKIELHEESLSLSFWFMRDNHTFIKLQWKNLKKIKKKIHKVAKANPYGMLCAPILLDKNGCEIRRLEHSAHVNGNGKVDSTKWEQSLFNDKTVKQLLKL